MRVAVMTAGLALLTACNGDNGGSNLGAASGNTLNQAQIDAALGPADQAQAPENQAENVSANEVANTE